MKKYPILLSLSSCLLSSCGKYIYNCSRIVKDGVRYVCADDFIFADCFVIKNNSFLDNTCSVEYVLDFGQFDGTYYFGRHSAIKGPNLNKYDKTYSSDSGYGSCICFRFDEISNFNDVPTIININIIIQETASIVFFQRLDAIKIYYWFPSVDEPNWLQKFCIKLVYLSIHINFVSGCNFNDNELQLLKNSGFDLNDNELIFDNQTSLMPDYLDHPRGEIYYD